MEQLTDKRKETNWCVYRHLNEVNGKMYVGITSSKPTTRWNNGNGYKHNKHFYGAIQKYGRDAFRHDILYTGLTQEEAARLEIKLIAKYQTQDPDKGYNIASGGCINSGWHLSAEQKERLSTSQKGRVFSEETRAKLREAWKTRTVSPETRTKQSRMRKGTCMGGSHHHARAVICVETGEVFPAIADAERAKGVFSESIGRAARNGGDHTAGGYHWRYADEAVISHA